MPPSGALRLREGGAEDQRGTSGGRQASSEAIEELPSAATGLGRERRRASLFRALECAVRFLPILAFLLALAPPDPSSVTLLLANRAVPVSAAENGTLLSIPDLVAALGGSSRPQPGASLAVELSGHRIVAADGVATVASDDRVVMLAHPTRAFSGILYAPWEFFEKTVFPAAGLIAEYDRGSRKIRTRTGNATAATVDVGVVHLNKTSQVIFQESSAVPFDAYPSKEGYTISFKTPIAPVFAERSFDDPFVSKVRFSQNAATLALRDSGLAFAPYALKNPDRLVVEITKAEAAAGTASQAFPRPNVAPPARTVVIDPGHGGEETGAIGPGKVVEKEITLDIASRLSSLLAREPGVRAVLTRTSDTLVALDERAAIANHEKAAVFLSIHANSSRATGAHGSETYYLSLAASDKLADAVAKQENAPDGKAAVPPSDAPPQLDFILWDMAQSAHLKESAALAESIQNELNSLLHTENRGIKQAPFRVLVGATMPAVLVEAGFLSNPEEAKQLETQPFRQSVAEAIARAISSYLKLHPAAPTASP
jgi:N-acetylmuramoyl-L-alanine amidase